MPNPHIEKFDAKEELYEKLKGKIEEIKARYPINIEGLDPAFSSDLMEMYSLGREEAIKECLKCLPKALQIRAEHYEDKGTYFHQATSYNACRAQTLKCLSAKMQENGK